MSRIAIIAPTLDVAGGSVRVAVWMANRLCDLHEVHVISCAQVLRPAFPIDGSVVLHSVALLEDARIRQKAIEAHGILNEIFGRIKPDVVFGIGVYETLYALLPSKKHHARLVFCDHGALINQWHDKQLRVMRLLDSFFSDRTVVLTPFNAKDYQSKLRTPRRKLLVIPNSIPNGFVQKKASMETKRIIWAGRLSPEKGVDFLIEIAKRVLPSRPDWSWDVYGELDSSLSFDPSKRIRDAGIEEQLLFKGRANDMSKIYPNYSIGCLTSYREGFPLFLLESRAYGLVPMSFEVAHGPSSLISDGKSGFLIKPFDIDTYAQKLSLLMDNENLRGEMSSKALEGLEKYSEDEIIKQWESLIEELDKK